MVDIYALANYIPTDAEDPLISENLQRALDAAVSAVQGSVGEDIDEVLPDDPRIDQLILLYAKDLFEERDLTGKAGAGQRALISTLETQLRLERRRRLKEMNGA